MADHFSCLVNISKIASRVNLCIYTLPEAKRRIHKVMQQMENMVMLAFYQKLKDLKEKKRIKSKKTFIQKMKEFKEKKAFNQKEMKKKTYKRTHKHINARQEVKKETKRNHHDTKLL